MLVSIRRGRLLSGAVSQGHPAIITKGQRRLSQKVKVKRKGKLFCFMWDNQSALFSIERLAMRFATLKEIGDTRCILLMPYGLRGLHDFQVHHETSEIHEQLALDQFAALNLGECRHAADDSFPRRCNSHEFSYVYANRKFGSRRKIYWTTRSFRQ
jgi:hypothetical protein